MNATSEMPRTIFTVSTGRCGTDFLAKILGRLDGVHSEHEPSPDFVEVMRISQDDPSAAMQFLKDRKLPAIQSTSAPNYVETSHLFCKGFFEPLFELGVLPDVIFLSRNPRDIAKSLCRIGTIPARTENGLKYLLSPADPDVLPLDGWEQLTDYQLCYWYCLETARRGESYREFLRRFGKSIPRISLDKLSTWHGFRELAYALRLKRPSHLAWIAWRRRLRQPTNTKSHIPLNGGQLSLEELDRQEADVKERVSVAQHAKQTRERAFLPELLAAKGAHVEPAQIAAAKADLAPLHAEYLKSVSTADMAVSLELASFMLALCRSWKPQRVVDLGSGFSSYVLRRYAAETGDAVVASVDDDKLWLARTGDWLKQQGLGTDQLFEWSEFKARMGKLGPFDLTLYDMGSMATRISELRPVLTGCMHKDSLMILDDVHKTDYEQYARYVCRSMQLRWADASDVSFDAINRHSAVVAHA